MREARVDDPRGAPFVASFTEAIGLNKEPHARPQTTDQDREDLWTSGTKSEEQQGGCSRRFESTIWRENWR